jgi:hypothetical protein
VDAPFAAVKVVCRNASQTKPEGHAAVGPVTQTGAQIPLPTPPSASVAVKQEQSAVVSAPVQGAPGALVGGTTWLTQLPLSTWHVVPDGHWASAVHADTHAPMAAETSPRLSSDSPNTAQALPATHAGFLPFGSTWH